MVGVGLVGGSVAWGAKQRGLAREVIGVDSDRAAIRNAIDRGIVDAVAAPVDAIAAITASFRKPGSCWSRANRAPMPAVSLGTAQPPDPP